jgi:hypothetical protein
MRLRHARAAKDDDARYLSSKQLAMDADPVGGLAPQSAIRIDEMGDNRPWHLSETGS